ncbi:hypothetical protein Hypma_016181 [Hypsizygus marmoreus]|uniref:Uncharacterized protein n=1 Tax=Hypsizygus marmoreus TaxID=39966 RepID=A0A369IYY3_HYPMA|nr:hypothetical protein Hypma_016181 [Hypsizygus marmoreus]
MTEYHRGSSSASRISPSLVSSLDTLRFTIPRFFPALLVHTSSYLNFMLHGEHSGSPTVLLSLLLLPLLPFHPAPPVYWFSMA